MRRIVFPATLLFLCVVFGTVTSRAAGDQEVALYPRTLARVAA